ncbi:hypothetical protein LHA01_15150 [Schleiferilactobacillus harbinensis]|uniref:Uncharacterized protein n=1 Tax=Schleiferilactobacillus harbinensis DSM 16991 TaxID=1122147 RepID=A0A0R1XGG9_9LACO|nr:hypothetical protein FC91_GL000848 [Schleiferilactobacillus harbinensis DSM 16991]GEK06276.1 hypothetical protein LHA01_15150 [Schleiferilactobacillus harbinensis]
MIFLTTLITVLGSAEYLHSKQANLPASRLLVPWHDDGDALLYSVTNRTLPQFSAAAYFSETNRLGIFGPDDFYHFWYLHFKRTDNALFNNALTPAFLQNILNQTGAAGLWLGQSATEKRAWLMVLAVQEPPLAGGHLRDQAPAQMQDYIERSRHSLSGFFAHVYITEEKANAIRSTGGPAAPTA